MNLAAVLSRKAADQDYKIAQPMLSIMLISGQRVQKNRVEGISLLAKAAARAMRTQKQLQRMNIRHNQIGPVLFGNQALFRSPPEQRPAALDIVSQPP